MTNESRLKLTPQAEQILGLDKKVILAIEIFSYGGRTTIVRSLCKISKRTANKLYKEIYQIDPPSGLLPYDENWCIKSHENCLHSSIFYNIYQYLSKNVFNQSKAELFVNAYKVYVNQTQQSEKLDINRAWHLVQLFDLKYLNGMHCQKCNTDFVSVNSFTPEFRLCPLCDVSTGVRNRFRWRYRDH